MIWCIIKNIIFSFFHTWYKYFNWYIIKIIFWKMIINFYLFFFFEIFLYTSNKDIYILFVIKWNTFLFKKQLKFERL